MKAVFFSPLVFIVAGRLYILNILYMIISTEGLDGLLMRPLSINHTALCSWKLAGLSEVPCPFPISRTRTFNISANFCSFS